MPTVIYVEDEELVFEFVSAVLAMRPNLDVHSYRDPVQARAKIKGGEAIDLVITDWDMPDLDGGDIIESCIGKISTVVVMSALGKNLQDAKNRFKEQINLLTITKPCGPREILQVVKEATEISYDKNLTKQSKE